MIDTHCHLTFKQLSGDVEGVIDRAAAVGVRGMITVSVTPANCLASLDLAKRHANVWCTAGMHPLYADEPRDWETIRRVAADERCVAFGELGLDNHYDKPPGDIQRAVLAEQLEMVGQAYADGIEKPIVLHCRDAFADLIPILRETGIDPGRFVFHCFTAGPDEARMALDFGAWISFTGVVTFKNAPEVGEAAKLVPEDRIMVETDAPYLAPAPHRKVWPNEPQYVVHTARHIADLRGADPAEFERTLDANAERFFGITLPA